MEEYPAGQAVVTEGEPGEMMYLIEDGQVCSQLQSLLRSLPQL